MRRPKRAGGHPIPNIGTPELIIILAIVLLLFGGRRLPGLARSMGEGLREFKDSVAGKDREGKAKEEDGLPDDYYTDPPALDPPGGSQATEPAAARDSEPVKSEDAAER